MHIEMATSTSTSSHASSGSSSTDGVFSPEPLSDTDSDDDLCVVRESVDNSRIQVRVEEYLNASKLGRLAYAAGDVQLAKDRFNLALDLEMQTELESFTDFGVTGGQLRAELQRRSSESDVPIPVEKSRDKYTTLLAKLERVYVGANHKTSKEPDNPEYYLQMGAALCIINEWDRAKQVYQSGIAACKDNQCLKACLEKMKKLDDMIHLVCQGKAKDITSPKHGNDTLARRSQLIIPRPNSLSDTNDFRVPRSTSFGNSEKCVRKSAKGSLQSPRSPASPLSVKRSLPIQHVNTTGCLDVPDSPSPSSSPKHSRRAYKSLSSASSKKKKRNTVFNLFKSNSKKSMEKSPSLDDLSKESEEREVWRNCFLPEFCSVAVEDASISSQTLEYMRAMNSVDHDSPSPDREL